MPHYVVRIETLTRLPNGDVGKVSKSTIPAATADDCKTFASSINRSNRSGESTVRTAIPCVQVSVRTSSYIIPLEQLEDTVRDLSKALDEHQQRQTTSYTKPALRV